MATSAVAVLLLVIYWALNHGVRNRLAKAKFLGFLYDPQRGILPLINLAALFGAGFGLSQWLSGFVAWFNFEIFGLGIHLFTVLMLAGSILFVVDIIDRGGIKKSSYGISFGMPIIAASSGGAIAALIITVSGSINAWAGSVLSTLVA